MSSGLPWALRGSFLGAGGAAWLLIGEQSRRVPTTPVLWGGAALAALCLLLIAEAVRRRSDRWSQGFAGAGVAALLVLGLFLAITRPAPEAGYPLLLAAAVYSFLWLGPETGLLVSVAGLAAGGFVAATDAGGPLLLCLLFIAFARPAPSRWQIASLLGIGVICAVVGLSGRLVPELSLLPMVIAPWLLHFGSPRPWRWTAIAALLALLWFWPAENEEPRTAVVALALAAGLLLLAVPLARRLARALESTAARAALQPLLAAAVVAISWSVRLEMEPRWPWIGALLAAPLLGWIGWRLSARWLWIPAAMASLAALGIWMKSL